MYPSQLVDFSKGVLSVVFFVSNLLFWRQSNYFAPDVDENPLLHTWSLAVEEQFYIFFPLVLLLLWRWRPRMVLPGLAMIALLSLGLAELGWRIAPGANFFLIPTRAWELLAGSLCAMAPQGAQRGRARRFGGALAAAGMAAILLSVFLFDEETPFPSLYALLPVGGTVLIVLFADAGTWTGRLLSVRIMVGTGLISYSAYLWHQPLFAFARIASYDAPGPVLVAVLIGATFGLAWLSWRFVEQPFRAGPKSVLTRRRSVFIVSGAGMAVFAVLGLSGILGKGLPGRTAPSGVTFAALDIDTRLRATAGLTGTCDPSLAGPGYCRSTGGAPQILLWGDSFARHLGHALRESPTKAGIVEMTKPVCAPILGISVVNAKYPERWSAGCIGFNDRVMDWIAAQPGLRAVVMSSPMGILDSRVYLRDATVASGDVAPLVARAMRETARRIRDAGAVPVFVAPPPRTGANLASCAVRRLVFGGSDGSDCSFARADIWPRSHEAREFLATLAPDMDIVALDDLLCEGDRCRTRLGDAPMFIDSGHFSREGSAALGRDSDLTGRVLTLADRAGR